MAGRRWRRLLKKTGSQSPEKRFRQMIRHLVDHDHLPDYSVSFDPATDMVTLPQPGRMAAALPSSWEGGLDPEAYGDARGAAPGWDVYYLEREWRRWLGENEIAPSIRSGTSSSSAGAGTKSVGSRKRPRPRREVACPGVLPILGPWARSASVLRAGAGKGLGDLDCRPGCFQ